MVKTITNKEIKQIKKLYSSGKSISETAKILNLSQSKTVYWMKKIGINRRNHSDAAYIKQNPLGDPFIVKKVDQMNKNEIFLYGIGLGLYWGEGNKALKCGSLRITNSDPGLIRTFMRFVDGIYKLDKKRFSFSIVSFNDVNPETARNYWAKELKISPNRFGKITVVPTQGMGTYKKKSQYGICTVQGNNIKLRKLVIEEIEKLKRL